MADEANFEDDISRTRYTQPHSGKHPIPTIQGYREHRKELRSQYEETEKAQKTADDDSRPKRAYDTAKQILKGQDDHQTDHDIYPTLNRNSTQQRNQTYDNRSPNNDKDDGGDRPESKGAKQQQSDGQSATEYAAQAIDPRDKRKAMKHANRRGGGGREVTDPVTHLPTKIYDQTDKDLNSAPENEQVPGSHPRTATGLSGAEKSSEQLEDERNELQCSHSGMLKTFPPPEFKDTEREIESVYKLALTVGLSAVLGFAATATLLLRFIPSPSDSRVPWLVTAIVLVLLMAAGAGVIVGVRSWLGKKVSEIWEDEVWDAARAEEKAEIDEENGVPESVQWLNSLMASVWPLINPDLFAALIDTLEDVMQASLPKVVRMVSVDDMGQGTEALRILGIKWLPTGAAGQSVDDDGNVRKPTNDRGNDRTAPGQGQEDAQADDEAGSSKDEQNDGLTSEEKKQKQQEQEAIREGMEAEEGDFVNMELAFAYRARSSGKSLETKAKNAHLYLKFYLPGGICVPVWVELRGIVGIMRLRLQLTPDPPFFSLCTLTFLGQPRANLSCVPLSRHSLNLMDVPLISSFVQSSIDAALAEYVAPKSLTLDLKDMLMGEDFKKDTNGRGVVWIYIGRARDFKQGDGGIGPFEGSSDSYVTVSWGKFGKPVASTRIIENTQTPVWNEWASILVTAEELNAGEKLKLQLWDSDKWTADDDLGKVELDLAELMHGSSTKNKICERNDRLHGQDADEKMPGSLTWSVGYFEKSHISQKQLDQQTFNQEIRSKEKLKEEITKRSENKLREATRRDHEKEIHQQKIQDYAEEERNMIISAPPRDDKPCGILSIQIHNITGLELRSKNNEKPEGDTINMEDDEEISDKLPDSYCTIILNHSKIYRTRTKPKNAKPFFNAGTERFIKDWRNSEIIISVRDSREKEDDALLGVVYLPLDQVFSKKSQVMQDYPLAGGIGYGRARISLVFRSVELDLPRNLSGWDYGTLGINGGVRPKGHLEGGLESCRIKMRTNLSRTKLHHNDGKWTSNSKRGDSNSFLAVRKRYASALVVEFRKSALGPDKTPAFAVMWLSELVDEEDATVTLKVWKGSKDALQRASSCADYQGMDENEQPLGEIEFTIRFWRGLSGYHKSHANKSKNGNVRNVMECLDTINDENLGQESDDDHTETDDSSDSGDETEHEDSPHHEKKKKPKHGNDDTETQKKLKTHTNQSSDNSDGSDIESSEDNGFSKVKAPVNTIKEGISKIIDSSTDQSNEEDGSRGARAQIRDYKDHHRQLHRKHKGVMQWKSARKLDWMGGRMKRAKGKVSEIFEHSDKDQGIETEV